MKIVVLSDQHGELPEIPPCDLLILSGDITGGNNYGPRDFSEGKWDRWLWNEFTDWIGQIDTSMVVAVAGNHDTVFEQFAPPPCIEYLCDSGIEFRGLKIWGTPWTQQWDGLAFNVPSVELIGHWNKIPHDTDILVCHQPPFGYGDIEDVRNLGCHWLRQRIQQVKPRLVTCGHIHGGRGIYTLDGSTVINAACAPITFELEIPLATA